MCVVSAVMDYGRTRIPAQQWTPASWDQFKEILERLDALDEALAQPDCEDPAKAEWMKEIEDRLAKLEKATPKGKKKS